LRLFNLKYRTPQLANLTAKPEIISSPTGNFYAADVQEIGFVGSTGSPQIGFVLLVYWPSWLFIVLCFDISYIHLNIQ